MSIIYIVMTSSAPSGSKGCRSKAMNIAIVEVDQQFYREHGLPKMISPRARGVNKIVRLWANCYRGKTPNCDYYRTLKRACDISADMNQRIGSNVDETA